jgi:superfamily II RNA helicase
MTREARLAEHVANAENGDALLEAFLAYASDLELSLYPAQEEAILELYAGKHLILGTPTGSGKSLVASALHAKAVSPAARGRSFYTAPIKALVGEKFFALCRELGARNVGLMTGDATVNRDAPVICCTAEILSNLALLSGPDSGVESVVMDEFHYYGDRDRGVAWQVPLLVMKNTQFLLMSATLGDTKFLERDLEDRTGREVAAIRSMQRPVPLEFEYRETPLHETVASLALLRRTPVYVVHFTQRGAAEHAQDLMSAEVIDKDRKHAIKEMLHGFRWDTPFGKDLARWVKHGVGVHHAGLLPKYRLLVEKLAQQGLLGVICGTDTLGVGVNVPIRSVLFTQLCKFDGNKTSILSVRDFHQIAGRAGRKGFDDRGWVVAQAPEHVIENKIAREKAQGDAKKTRKLVMKKPPERGYTHFDEQTFERLRLGEPERLDSRFKISQGMLLTVLKGASERGEDGCRQMKEIIRTSHEGRPRRFAHGRHAIALFRSLREAGVVEIGREEHTAYVHTDLQDDFSLHQTLSLFVLDTVPRLDPEDPLYAVNALSVVESILENPEVVLMRQLDRLKDLKISELKAQGVEYDERMAELDKVQNPRPCEALLENAYAEFRTAHPWAPKPSSEEGLRPKSIARDMWERGASFTEYVKEYGLARSEGVLLRYLSDAYKAFVQNVPESAKNEEIYDIADWLRAIVKQVDSSLLDEWESLRDPTRVIERRASAELDSSADDITRDPKALTVLVRNAMFRIVRALSRREYDEVASLVLSADGEPEWTGEAIAEAVVAFEVEHGAIRIDPQARAPRHTAIEMRERAWHVLQTIVDAEDICDFYLEAEIDLARTREAGEPIVVLLGIKQG